MAMNYFNFFNKDYRGVRFFFMLVIVLAFTFLIYLYRHRAVDDNQSTRLNYGNLNIVKYVLALIIIITHLRPFLNYNRELDVLFNNMISRICVPFFLLTTGYFVANKEKSDSGYILKYVKAAMPTYIFWSLVYIPFSVVAFFNFSAEGVQFLDMFTVQWSIFIVLFPMVLLLGFIYIGVYYHLWYYPALLLSLVVLFFWKKKYKVKHLLLISGILLFFGVSETYYGILSDPVKDVVGVYFDLFLTTRNFLFFGLFYVVLGYFMGLKKSFYLKHSMLKLILSFTLLIVEVVLAQNIVRLNSNILLMAIPVVYYLFIVLLYSSDLIKSSRKYNFRELYKYYYLVHPAVIYLYLTLFGHVARGWNIIVEISVVIILTHLISIGIIKYKEKHKSVIKGL